MIALAAIVAALAGPFAGPVQCVSVAQFNQDAGEAQGQLWAYGIAGGVFWQDRHVELTLPTCKALQRLSARPSALPSLVQSVAAFTLAHEVGHLLYGPDEATADRYGLAHASAVAYMLGLRHREQFVVLADFVREYAPLHPGVAP